MQNDMTKGSPLRLIVFFTIPVLLGNIFQNVYNLMDSIIVGRFLGVNALAAVGATGTLTFLVFGWITGMTGGFGILLAQSFGAGDEKRLRHYTVMSLYLCVAMAVLMTAGLLLVNRGILKLMNTPDTILDDTAGYIGIIYAGLPVTIAYNMLSSVSRSLGDSRTPLIFLIISSVLNIILDIVLITVIPLGVRGAAYATVIAQVVSAVACFFYVKKKYEILKIRKGEWGFSWASAGKTSDDGSSDGPSVFHHRHWYDDGAGGSQSAGSYLYCGFFRRRKDLQHCDAAVPVSWSDPGYLCGPEHGRRKDQKDPPGCPDHPGYHNHRRNRLRSGGIYLGRYGFKTLCC